ncbi:MarR family winged helix-turn-helix transcriptional regulator [Leucobacter chinensis]|uniref:MarR family winged helix-turn-helix transcriptional regulator n=1 Tax=Leucobacter chinensis TaxID=2851010 RepID=UPI001C24FAF1|nr:MarR family winged helix-turn-helix transcriptional regulator [Leucobacter chinensis]
MHEEQHAPRHEHPEGSIAAYITDIISEFSEVFASARTNWSRYAETVHPELSGGGLMVLQFILRKGPVTATGISQVLDMDKALVSRQIARLREFNLVEARPAPDDRRVQLLTGTAESEEIMAEVRTRWAHSYHERFEGWNASELLVLRDALHRFNAGTVPPNDGPATRCAQGHREAAAE